MSREKSIELLQQLIKEQKARIDPDILKKAQEAQKIQEARKAEQPPAPPPQEKSEIKSAATADNKVPYDREAASKAVELFLKNHSEGVDFQKRLLAFINKSKH